MQEELRDRFRGEVHDQSLGNKDRSDIPIPGPVIIENIYQLTLAKVFRYELKVVSPPHRLDPSRFETGRCRVIDLKEVNSRELRCQPPAKRVVPCSKNKYLCSAVTDAFPYLPLTESLPLPKGLKLARQHPVKGLINGDR